MAEKLMENREGLPGPTDSLAKAYIDYIDAIPKGESRTWNDFYDAMGNEFPPHETVGLTVRIIETTK